MKINRGFTLVELLAVIVILAIVLAIAIPSISSIVSNSKVSAYNNQMDLIKRAANLYVAKQGIDSGNTAVSLNDLVTAGLLQSSSITNPVTGQPFGSINVLVKKSNGSTDYEVYEGPELATGMIPVYYDGTNWVKADTTNPSNQWYNYNTQQWANAVTVVTSGTQTRAYYQSAAAGTTIAMADINAFFVWVPRYSYKIPAGAGAREILISFETKYTPKSTGDAINTYLTHPAFTLGTTELGGIWVGKFETTGTSTAPTILPDALSLRSLIVKAMYDTVKNYMQGSSTFGFSNTDSDAHMMKNAEWGAVAYLYHSKYGKYGNASYVGVNKELYKNNSSGYYTGRSMGTPGGVGVLTPTYEYSASGYYTYDGKCAMIYAGLTAPCTSGGTGQILTDKTYAYGASTTGNIYGIYDISGGSYEYVMGMYKPSPVPATGIADAGGYSTVTTDSQYDLLTINNKYYNQYLGNDLNTNYMLGDATKETNNWYSDGSAFVLAANPWFFRGGAYSSLTSSGAFYIGVNTGSGSGSYSFHTVIATNP